MERIDIYKSLNLDLSIERNRIIQELYDYISSKTVVQSACKAGIYMHEQLPKSVQTKEDFIEFFSDTHNHIRHAGVEVIKLIREYLGILVVFDGLFLIDSESEQRKVYTYNLESRNIQETANKFNISYIEAKIIISKFENTTIDNFLMYDIRNFLKKRRPNFEVKVCNSLGRYLSQNPDITTKAQLRKIIYEDETYIRNFGEKAKTAMKEYFFTQ